MTNVTLLRIVFFKKAGLYLYAFEYFKKALQKLSQQFDVKILSFVCPFVTTFLYIYKEFNLQALGKKSFGKCVALSLSQRLWFQGCI